LKGIFIIILVASILMLSCAENKKDKIKMHESQKIIDQPKIIAHQGGAKLAPGNTLAAFKNAIELGVDMIEIDVHLSKDSKVIVIHDGTIDATTDGSGEIKSMTLDEIKKYDAGTWFDKKFKNEHIPTLDEVMEILNGKVSLLIEIKEGDEHYPGLEERVVETIHKYNATDWAFVQSFNEKTVLKVKKMDPAITTFYLLGTNFNEYYSNLADKVSTGKNIEKKYDGIAPHFSFLNNDKVKVFHQAGFSVFAWTVDEPDDMKKIVNINVDGIITNLPDKLKALLNN